MRAIRFAVIGAVMMTGFAATAARADDGTSVISSLSSSLTSLYRNISPFYRNISPF